MQSGKNHREPSLLAFRFGRGLPPVFTLPVVTLRARLVPQRQDRFSGFTTLFCYCNDRVSPGSSMVKESYPVLAAKRVLCSDQAHEITHTEALAVDVESPRCLGTNP